MKNDPHIKQILLTGPETTLEIKKLPAMGAIFLKALMISPFRPNTIRDDIRVRKTRIVLSNLLPDKDRIENYRQVCSFSGNRPGIIPISYLQTLFIGLLGKFITASFFPVNPLGLIQIFQSFDLKRPVAVHERLDLACTLSGIKKTEKGIEIDFALDVMSGGSIVWQGISTFFARNRVKKEKTRPKKSEPVLDPKETILVPADTGWRYARVSGDYNPHHLHTASAKLFGFNRAIAHGMWSLARVVASLDREFGIQDAATIEAAFKLPIFMPATTVLGYNRQNHTQGHPPIVHFELRDKQKGLPHLKGRLLYKN